MDQLGVVEILGGSIYSVERGNLTPGREAFSHLGLDPCLADTGSGGLVSS